MDKALIKKAVQFINQKANEHLYKASVEIGAYVLKHFFDDDIKAAGSRNPRKPASYRALCDNEGLAITVEALSVMVRVAAQEKFFLSKSVDSSALSYSHKAELVKLANDKEKIKLVKLVIQKSLPYRDLKARIQKMRADRPQPDLPLSRLIQKDVDNPERLSAKSNLEAVQDKVALQSELRAIDSERREELLKKAREKKGEIEQWLALYAALVEALEELKE